MSTDATPRETRKRKTVSSSMVQPTTQKRSKVEISTTSRSTRKRKEELISASVATSDDDDAVSTISRSSRKRLSFSQALSQESGNLVSRLTTVSSSQRKDENQSNGFDDTAPHLMKATDNNQPIRRTFSKAPVSSVLSTGSSNYRSSLTNLNLRTNSRSTDVVALHTRSHDRESLQSMASPVSSTRTISHLNSLHHQNLSPSFVNQHHVAETTSSITSVPPQSPNTTIQTNNLLDVQHSQDERKTNDQLPIIDRPVPHPERYDSNNFFSWILALFILYLLFMGLRNQLPMEQLYRQSWLSSRQLVSSKNNQQTDSILSSTNDTIIIPNKTKHEYLIIDGIDYYYETIEQKTAFLDSLQLVNDIHLEVHRIENNIISQLQTDEKIIDDISQLDETNFIELQKDEISDVIFEDFDQDLINKFEESLVMAEEFVDIIEESLQQKGLIIDEKQNDGKTLDVIDTASIDNEQLEENLNEIVDNLDMKIEETLSYQIQVKTFEEELENHVLQQQEASIQQQEEEINNVEKNISNKLEEIIVSNIAPYLQSISSNDIQEDQRSLFDTDENVLKIQEDIQQQIEEIVDLFEENPMKNIVLSNSNPTISISNIEQTEEELKNFLIDNIDETIEPIILVADTQYLQSNQEIHEYIIHNTKDILQERIEVEYAKYESIINDDNIESFEDTNKGIVPEQSLVEKINVVDVIESPRGAKILKRLSARCYRDNFFTCYNSNDILKIHHYVPILGPKDCYYFQLDPTQHSASIVIKLKQPALLTSTTLLHYSKSINDEDFEDESFLYGLHCAPSRVKVYGTLTSSLQTGERSHQKRPGFFSQMKNALSQSKSSSQLSLLSYSGTDSTLTYRNLPLNKEILLGEHRFSFESLSGESNILSESFEFDDISPYVDRIRLQILDTQDHSDKVCLYRWKVFGRFIEQVDSP
jgi:hypothetical protein